MYEVRVCVCVMMRCVHNTQKKCLFSYCVCWLRQSTSNTQSQLTAKVAQLDLLFVCCCRRRRLNLLLLFICKFINIIESEQNWFACELTRLSFNRSLVRLSIFCVCAVFCTSLSRWASKRWIRTVFVCLSVGDKTKQWKHTSHSNHNKQKPFSLQINSLRVCDSRWSKSKRLCHATCYFHSSFLFEQQQEKRQTKIKLIVLFVTMCLLFDEKMWRKIKFIMSFLSQPSKHLSWDS